MYQDSDRLIVVGGFIEGKPVLEEVGEAGKKALNLDDYEPFTRLEAQNNPDKLTTAMKGARVLMHSLAVEHLDPDTQEPLEVITDAGSEPRTARLVIGGLGVFIHTIAGAMRGDEKEAYRKLFKTSWAETFEDTEGNLAALMHLMNVSTMQRIEHLREAHPETRTLQVVRESDEYGFGHKPGEHDDQTLWLPGRHNKLYENPAEAFAEYAKRLDQLK